MNGRKITTGGLAACGLLIRDDGKRAGFVIFDVFDGEGVPILTRSIGTIRSVRKAAKRIAFISRGAK